jgi:hypothetical protein
LIGVAVVALSAIVGLFWALAVPTTLAVTPEAAIRTAAPPMRTRFINAPVLAG